MTSVWSLGDDVDTDQLAPGQYMKYDIARIATHCLEATVPRFASQVRPGDILIAGHNFGCGSSREQAAAALVYLGVRAVVARSFAGLFHRNAFNLGLLLVKCDQPERLLNRSVVEIDATSGVIRADNERLPCEPVPTFLLDYVAAGGLLPHLKARLRKNKV
jgi:3-isopropylmalate/(R)-2-methylmalate dehydratase small subunit